MSQEGSDEVTALLCYAEILAARPAEAAAYQRARFERFCRKDRRLHKNVCSRSSLEFPPQGETPHTEVGAQNCCKILDAALM
jgi:hypothetical protein